MLKIFTIAILSFSWIFSQVHEISGKTVDANNRTAVAGVNIIISDGDDGVASNVNGDFILRTHHDFPIPISISHIGYDPLNISVKNDSFLLIELTSAVIAGQGIEVMGARRKVEIDVASAVDRIDIEAIELQGARDIGSALRRVSSLQLNYANSGKQTVSIRGGNATDVVVFLDGIRINDSNTGVADLSFIDLNSIDQIQVVKGGGSALFGSDAIGGVVNVESKRAKRNSVYFTEGIGQTYQDDLDLSYGVTAVHGPVGIGGRTTGKKRAFGGRTITTTIFNNAFGGLNIYSGRFDISGYQLAKTLEFESGSVTSDDGLEVISGKYSGPIFRSKNWTIMSGKRAWRLDQNYFTSVNETLDDGSLVFQLSKGFFFRDIKNTLQIESEKQYFNGDRSYFDVDGFQTEVRVADMSRETRALALVSRWEVMSFSPVIDHINWEFSFRFNRIHTILDEKTRSYLDDISDTNLILNHEEFPSIVASKRLGVYVEGQTQKVRYSLFVNSGNNSRLPTLSDRFRFAHTRLDSSTDSLLNREQLSATEANLDMTFMDVQSDLPISEIHIILGFFINNYTNKIGYRLVEEGPAVPFNDITAGTQGVEASVKMNFLDGKFLLGSNGTWIGISNIRVFPDKPEYRFVSTAELNLGWFTFSYDYINEGKQFYYVAGFGEGIRKPRQNSNLNITFQKKLWKVNCSLSYTVRNIMSKDELDLTLEESIRKGFNYFERYREIITFKISL